MQRVRNATVAFALLAISCSGFEPPRTPAPASIPLVSQQASTSEVAAPLVSSGNALQAEARTLFGSIARLTESELSFDEAELFVGTAANDAARAAGELDPGEQVYDDYYIRDDDHQLVTFPIATNVEVHLLKRSGPSRYTETVTSKTTLATLVHYFQDPDDRDGVRKEYYQLVVRAGKVTRVEEVFFP